MQDDVSVFFLLLNNISVFVVLVVGYSFLIDRLQKQAALPRQLVLGVFFGAITFISMHVKIPVAEGVIVDQRNALVVLSGAFGGPVAALIAGGFAAAFRAYLGGAGALAGIFGVTLSAVVGTVLYMVRWRSNSVVVLLFGALGAVVFTAPGFLLVGDFAYGLALMERMALPWGMALFVGIFLGGLLLSREDRRLKAEQDKAASEAQFRTLYEGSVVPILDMNFSGMVAELRKLRDQGVTDIDASIAENRPEVRSLEGQVHVNHANPAAVSLYSAEKIEDLIGPFDGRYGPEGASLNPAITRAFWDGESSVQVETTHHTFQGEKRTVLVSMPIPATIDGPLESFRSLPVSVLDMTEHKEAEVARDEALLKAEQASKAKSEFLAAMSHELRTPLNAILGFSEILQSQLFGPLGDSKYADYARHINASGTLLLELVNDILDIAAIEAGRKNLSVGAVDLNKVVDECLAIVEHRARAAGVDLRKELPEPDASAVLADKRALQQVLLNLLTNAVKYTPQGGSVAVTAKFDPSGTEILVSDTGCGIPADRLSEVTNAFVRGTDDPHVAQEGWGLGLSIAKSLVELHKGDFTINSSVGDGTSIRFTLPRQLH